MASVHGDGVEFNSSDFPPLNARSSKASSIPSSSAAKFVAADHPASSSARVSLHADLKENSSESAAQGVCMVIRRRILWEMMLNSYGVPCFHPAKQHSSIFTNLWLLMVSLLFLFPNQFIIRAFQLGKTVWWANFLDLLLSSLKFRMLLVNYGGDETEWMS